MVKLPDSDGLLKLKTPTVPTARITRGQIDACKLDLVKQIGKPVAELKQEIAARGTSIDATAGQQNGNEHAANAPTGKDWKNGFWMPRAGAPSNRLSATDTTRHEDNYRKTSSEKISGQM
jgi:hypothetical protein